MKHQDFMDLTLGQLLNHTYTGQKVVVYCETYLVCYDCTVEEIFNNEDHAARDYMWNKVEQISMDKFNPENQEMKIILGSRK